MAMLTGGSRRSVATINVTPLIDVLLVLLILFMVITPMQPVGLEAQVPQPSPESQTSEVEARTVVVSIDRDGGLSINTQGVQAELLAARLQEIFKSRASRLVFVKADPDVEFRVVAATIDTIKGAGIDRIGLLGKNS